MFKPLILSFLGGALIVVIAGAASIGTVKSNGDFRIDGSTIRGNTTVFDGNLIETAAVRSVLTVGAAQITMAPESRVKLYSGRVIMEKGTGSVRFAEGQVIEAATLRISSVSKGSHVEIETSGPNKVTVVARSGSVEVRNVAGILVARVDAGRAMQFDPQADATTATKMIGILKTKDGKYLLTSDTANVTVEIKGKEIAKYADKKVAVVGRTVPGVTPIAGAAQVVELAGIGLVSGGHKIVGAGVGIGAVALVAGVAVLGVAATTDTSAANGTTGSLGVSGLPPVSRP